MKEATSFVSLKFNADRGGHDDVVDCCFSDIFELAEMVELTELTNQVKSPEYNDFARASFLSMASAVVSFFKMGSELPFFPPVLISRKQNVFTNLSLSV